MNYHEPYLRTILGFIGIRDVHVVSAGGRDPDTVARTTAEVRAELRRLAAAYGAGGHAADGAARAA
jgi:FMN-dependent NADH-azoreductase